MTAFHELHRSGLLILPNAWDAGSAALMRSLGARAIATTSAGVAWALAYPDGDVLPVERVLGVAADVVRAAGGLPVSVDMEGGYSDDPDAVATLAKALVEAGAQGINIEDGGGAAEALVAKIAAIRAAVGADLFINARCDLWLAGVGAPEGRLAEAVRRAAVYGEAGADGFFAPGLADAETITALTEAVALPVNLLAMPGLPDAAALERLGVRRLSAGSGLAGAAYGRASSLARDFLSAGASEPMGEDALGWGSMNGLMQT